jgi:hypothetical protein
VVAIVDEQTAESLRDRIGPDADRIVFTDPVVAFAASPQTMVAQRRRDAVEIVARNGR